MKLIAKELPATWEEILARFPKQLQDEIKEEREGDLDDRWEFNDLFLVKPTPVIIDINEKFIYQNAYIIMSQPYTIINKINKNWGVSIDVNNVLIEDIEHSKVVEYSKLPSETAPPGVMVDGELWFGCHRFLAALLRKDNTYKAWLLRRVEK